MENDMQMAGRTAAYFAPDVSAGPIMGTLEELGSALARAYDRIDALRSVLASILTPEEPTNNKVSAQRMATPSLLHARLADHLERAEVIESITADLIRRIQL